MNLYKFISQSATIFLIILIGHFKLLAQQYDVEITFQSIKCFKVVEAPFDTQEDLFGHIGILYLKMKNTSGTYVIKGEGIPGANDRQYYHTFFDREVDLPFRIGLNETKSFNTYKTISNITYDQLLSIELGLGGNLMDEELMNYATSIKYRKCQECGTTNNRLVRMSQYKNQIDGILTSNSLLLNLDRGKVLELNYFEGDANSSHIRFNFQIKVTKK